MAAAPYVAETAGSTTQAPVNPVAFAGVASDGLPLAPLLFLPAVTVLGALGAGAPAGKALAAGRATLDMIVRTQVADAGRSAVGVAMAASRDIAGYERVVHLPACGRCIALAGKLYRWSTGFERHPRCDCTMAPVTSKEWREQRPENHPRALFERMDRAEQDKRFTKAGAQAIRDGADISQVVNARSGMTTAVIGGRTVATTTTGTTRRAVAGKRLAQRSGTVRGSGRYRRAAAPRLMPETIYQVAQDRDDAIRLLRANGYIF